MNTITRQLVPTHILQAIVNYLEAQPHKDVANLLKALMDTVQPEFPEQVKSQEAVVDDSVSLPDTSLDTQVAVVDSAADQEPK